MTSVMEGDGRIGSMIVFSQTSEPAKSTAGRVILIPVNISGGEWVSNLRPDRHIDPLSKVEVRKHPAVEYDSTDRP